jgi:hypothetical protein
LIRKNKNEGENEKKEKHHFRDAFLFVVTSSGEMTNFLMEDLERVLQFETIDKCEVSMKLEA